MKNRFVRILMIAMMAFMVSVPSFASRKDEVTLLMVPREDRVQQIGMDISNRYPTLFVSYKLGADGAVSLHGWSGSQWVTISAQDFSGGTFFRTGPDSALVVEKAGVPVPESLIPSGDWCAEVYKISTIDTRALLHLLGQYYDFKFKEWEWFAKRYGESVDGINPEGLNVAWYHKRLNEQVKSGHAAAGSEDLKYWVALRVPVAADPDALAETEAAGQPEMEFPNDLDVNPFTDDAPAAVLLGAGDVEATVDSSGFSPVEAPKEPAMEETLR